MAINESLTASLIRKNKALKAEIEKLQETIRTKNSVISKHTLDVNFIRSRIVEKYGRQAYKDLFNHVDCPNGFDAEKFDKKTERLNANLQDASN